MFMLPDSIWSSAFTNNITFFLKKILKDQKKINKKSIFLPLLLWTATIILLFTTSSFK